MEGTGPRPTVASRGAPRKQLATKAARKLPPARRDESAEEGPPRKLRKAIEARSVDHRAQPGALYSPLETRKGATFQSARVLGLHLVPLSRAQIRLQLAKLAHDRLGEDAPVLAVELIISISLELANDPSVLHGRYTIYAAHSCIPWSDPESPLGIVSEAIMACDGELTLGPPVPPLPDEWEEHGGDGEGAAAAPRIPCGGLDPELGAPNEYVRVARQGADYQVASFEIPAATKLLEGVLRIDSIASPLDICFDEASNYIENPKELKISVFHEDTFGKDCVDGSEYSCQRVRLGSWFEGVLPAIAHAPYTSEISVHYGSSQFGEQSPICPLAAALEVNGADDSTVTRLTCDPHDEAYDDDDDDDHDGEGKLQRIARMASEVIDAAAAPLAIKKGDVRIWVRLTQRGGHGDGGTGLAFLCRRCVAGLENGDAQETALPIGHSDPVMLEQDLVDPSERWAMHDRNRYNDCF